MTTQNLTPAGVHKLKPGKYWDQKQGGLVLDVKAVGKATWLVRGSMYVPPYVITRGKNKGKQSNRRDITHRIGSLGALGLVEARKKAALLVEKMKEGTPPKYVSEDRAATMQNAYDRWAEVRAIKKGSKVHVKNGRNYAVNYAPDWMAMAMVKIGPGMVADKYAEIARDHGPSAAENWRKTFTAAWNAQRKRLPDLPVCPNKSIERVQTNSEGQDYVRTIIPDLAKWWACTLAHGNQLQGMGLRFQLLSGLRAVNVWRLRREWVDIPGQVVRFPAAAMKSKKSKFDLPCSAPMLGILKEAMDLWGGELVFRLEDFGPESKPWVERSGPLKGFTGHIVRHAYSNLMIGMEVDPIKQMLLMHHSVGGIKNIYTNPATQFRNLLKTQEEISAHILKIVLDNPIGAVVKETQPTLPRET